MEKRELNKVNINVEFEETVNRQQLSSGDNIKTLFGKIKKWLSDLKAVAFSGSYNDLTDKPSIPQNKEDIGLGNVDNVAVNDMMPTFSTAATRSFFNSGEKISVIFGKIRKWFSDMKTVAFTGKYSDLTNTPVVYPTVAVSNKYDSNKTKYFHLATMWSMVGDEKYCGMCAYFDLFSPDWEPSFERCAIGFASYSQQTGEYIDGPTFATYPSMSNSSYLHNMLFFAYDDIDPYCIQVWAKLEPSSMFALKVAAYTCYNFTDGEIALDYFPWGSSNDVSRSTGMSIFEFPEEYTYETLPDNVKNRGLLYGSLT